MIYKTDRSCVTVSLSNTCMKTI